MKYYLTYRKKNHLKETIYERNVTNLIRFKLDIESIYRYQDVGILLDDGNLLDDVVEWRIYDENHRIIEIGVVEPTVKGKEVSWFVEV